MAGGSGARSFADGLDAGGVLDSPSAIIANIEDYEYSYPFLYLYRRIQPDTGGAGKYRGGATVSMAYIAHDTDSIPTKIMHAIGTQQPGAVGVAGGYPSCTNQFVIKRDTNIRELLAQGIMPAELEEIGGELEVYSDSIVSTSQQRDDVYRVIAMGGGGYGDPIDRDPAKVLADVVAGVVSVGEAKERYGVIIEPDTLSLDDRATGSRREDVRRHRRATAKPQGPPRARPASSAHDDGAR
jgi:N-methylhydantoinase B